MIDNGEFCPNCKLNQMPPWKSEQETARACQKCGTVEERKIRARGYYWVNVINQTYLNICRDRGVMEDQSIAYWCGKFWHLCGFGHNVNQNDVEVKGKVIQGEWKE